ncbi:hypothetical protein ABFX02_04G158400 [Erythranthe guttata]
MDKPQANLNLEEQSTTRQKRNKHFIICTTIFFTLLICAIISVFTVLKHQTEAESLSANPTAAIRSACHVTIDYTSCVESLLSSLDNHSHTIIHASDILRLSVAAGLRESRTVATHFQELASKIGNKNIKNPDSITGCQKLIVDSVDQLNGSLAMIATVDFDGELGSNELRGKMVKAANNVEGCYYGEADEVGPTIRVKIKQAEIYVRNSVAILDSFEEVKEMFDPSVGSVLASLMLVRENYVITVALFCTQYLVLIFLLCSVLRVFV